MGKHTPLYEQHLQAGARMVDFAGWDMPIQYHSVIEEHHHVRQQAGVFDVSHMTIVDVNGAAATAWLQHLLANDVAKLSPWQALYSGMLNEAGGVIDDLIVYRLDNGYRLVVNCATREKDLAWMQQQRADFDVSIEEQPTLAILAVQGPQAIDIMCSLLPTESADRLRALAGFHAMTHEDWLLARTGYTGEEGVEVMLPDAQAPALWQALLQAGVAPIGLAARDTLRLEAGMNLYGQDMDEETSPLAANMAWTIAWEPATRQFIGRSALEAERQRGDSQRLVGLLLEGRGVMRAGQRVSCECSDGSQGEGVITSGTFSPTLKQSIALARIPSSTTRCQVDMRGRLLPVQLVRPGFVRHGKPVIKAL